jgi:hypothetical protein
MKKIILSIFLISFCIKNSLDGAFAQVIASIFRSCCGPRKDEGNNALQYEKNQNKKSLILNDETIAAKKIPRNESTNSLTTDEEIIKRFNLFKTERRKKSSEDDI